MSAEEVGEIAPSVSNVNTRRTVEGRQARGKAPDIPIHERKNWLIHVHYIKKDFETCKVLIQELLAETGETCEYAIYVFGLISRQEGNIQLSLELFQKAVQLNPRNPENMKQMARSLFLLGRHKAALEAYAETQRLAPNDWEILHNQGVCHMHLKDLDKSIETFKQVLRHSQQAVTYIQLGKCYLMQNNLKDAVSVYQEAAEHNPEDPDILATMGLLYLELRQPKKAFEYLGNALTYDPCNTKAILAAGSMMQGYGDFDVALSKYRIAAVSSSESPQLWNNIGMCFFGKKKYVAAISCLKRAVYLAPFEWKILYNLGLVHLTMQQYSSAFHFLGAAISHKPKSSNLFMLLAVALTHMDDWVNAKQAYEQAIRLDKEDPVVRLNYAAALYNHREHLLAAKQFTHFEGIIKDKGVQQFDPEVVELSSKLGPILHVGEDLTWKPEVSQPQLTSPASGQPED